MIRNPTPGLISLLNALVLSLFVGILLFNLQVSLKTAAIGLPIFFIASYISIRVFLDLFIYRKIKLIYKIIHDHKSGKKEVKDLFKYKATRDPISTVNDEVLSWVIKQNSEISELKKQEEFRKEFLGNVSHELKTPIFNIQGYLDTLLDGAIHDPEVNIAFIKKAAKSADRLDQLVNDLLAISQMETGKLQMKYEKFDIYELCKEILEALEMRASKRKIKLGFKEGCERPFWVNADRSRIRQVLVNLIVNALNYGKEEGYVLVAFYDMDQNILIEVADNGEGIETEHLPRLFERFYRVDRSRSRDFGGTGLGLAIVKHIIESHQQNINVRSTLGKGSTFGFTLQKGK